MATTTNYNWATPDDTDLVKDGASAIRTLGSSIDTTVFNNAGAAVAKSIVDAKGDIIAATAADTVSRLAVGANDTVLTADSSTATGLKWAAPAGGGKVLQVVQGTLTTNASTTSGSFVDTGITVNITPASASNKVYVVVNFWGYVQRSGSVTANVGDYRLVRGATQLQRIKSGATFFASTSDPVHYYAMAFSYLDSPATTSATTYKVQFAQDAANNTTALFGAADQIASIVVMEIGA